MRENKGKLEVVNFLWITPPSTYFLITLIVNAITGFWSNRSFSFFLHNHRRMCCSMVLIDDVNTHMWYDDLWYSKHIWRSVSSTFPYRICNASIAKIRCQLNCTINVEKKDTRCVPIDIIMIHTSGVWLVLRVSLFRFLTVLPYMFQMSSYLNKMWLQN